MKAIVFAPEEAGGGSPGASDYVMGLRRFGSTNWQVAAIGQGTWYDEDDNRDTAVAALRRGIDLGMTHVDTAEM